MLGPEVLLVVAQREFILGENKYVEFKVKSTINQIIFITAATYELIKDGEVLTAGACEISDDIVSALVQPSEKGMFELVVTYVVGAETRKIKVNLKVI